MSIDTNNSASTRWDDAPEGATHYAIQDGVVCWLKDDYSFWNVWEDGVWAACGIPVARRIQSKPESITQAVFDGLPPEYRWAAVDADGSVHCFHEPPIRTNSGEWIYNKYLICEDWHDVATNWQNSLIERQDVSSRVEQLRSVEAARVAEQSERTYPHYFKDVSDVDAIDLYHVARLYDITDPALFHAFKKIACAGKRGAKDQAQDVQEAIDALKRWQELNV